MEKTPKIDRKELKGPDQFVKRGQVFVHLLENYRKQLMALVIIGLVTGLGIFAFRWQQDNKRDHAWEAYFKASKAADDKRVDEFKKVISEYSGTRAAYFAAIGLADRYFDEARKEGLKENGDPAKSAGEAAQWYQKASEYSGLEVSERQLLKINIAQTLEMQKKLDEAIAQYQAAADAEGTAKGYALLGVARVHELKADSAKATETYQKVATDFVNSEYAKIAKASLRRLKSPLYKDTGNL